MIGTPLGGRSSVCFCVGAVLDGVYRPTYETTTSKIAAVELEILMLYIADFLNLILTNSTIENDGFFNDW